MSFPYDFDRKGAVPLVRNISNHHSDCTISSAFRDRGFSSSEPVLLLVFWTTQQFHYRFTIVSRDMFCRSFTIVQTYRDDGNFRLFIDPTTSSRRLCRLFSAIKSPLPRLTPLIPNRFAIDSRGARPCPPYPNCFSVSDKKWRGACWLPALNF